MPSPLLEHTDQYLTGGYAMVSEDLMEVQIQATMLTGLLFDPTLHREGHLRAAQGDRRRSFR
ncbi:MAG: hypothetical protein OXC98_02645 [bacterium]|nr:hypothetical protein [Acidimicrobiia bacterium]MCY4649254.1 hypothetical protein [bacterium]